MLSTTGSGTAVTVQMSEWTLSRATDKVDVTSFGDLNKVSVQGLPDISGTVALFWDDLAPAPWTAADSIDGCKLYLYPSTNALTKYHYGPAWLDMSMSVSATGAVSMSGSFVAQGSWGYSF
jgi:hypothetical protein